MKKQRGLRWGSWLGFVTAFVALTAQNVMAGVPVVHLLTCCRGANEGATWLINGEWQEAHDYNDIDTVRDILQKVKDAGINIVSIDMTNPAQWHRESQRDYHMPMVDNIRKVTAEMGMEYLLFIGGQIGYLIDHLVDDLRIPGLHSDMTGVEYWNKIAGEVVEWKNSDSHYRTYGFDGDDRPILLVFLPGERWWQVYNEAPPEHKTNLEQFWIGTMEINDPIINPVASDGWGYRGRIQNADGSVRYTSPNAGVHPSTWSKLSPDEFRAQVQWVREASKYSVYGSYDDVCDQINWGISDTRNTRKPRGVKPANTYPGHEPTVYYNIIQEELVGCPEPAGDNTGDGLTVDRFDDPDLDFNVRMTGHIEFPYSGYYTFFGDADAYEKLVINGHSLFEDGEGQTKELGTYPFRITAGTKYTIEYSVRKEGDAKMTLEWTTACLPRQVVQASRLYRIVR